MLAHKLWTLLGRADSKYQPLEGLTRTCANNLWYISGQGQPGKAVVALYLLSNAYALTNPNCELYQDRWNLDVMGCLE